MAVESKEELLIRIAADVSKLKKDIDEGDEKVKGFSKSAKKNIKVLGAAFLATFVAIGAVIGKALFKFADFETGVVSVAKTTGLAGKDLQDFKDDISKLSTEIPVATKELLQIGAAAGQLGIKGKDNLLIFTETIAKLGATTDLVGEEASKQIARIINITGESLADVGKFGSTLVGLGNNLAASESEILRIASEVAKTTVQYKLSSSQVAGLSGALASLGVQSQLAGSSIGRSFRTIDATIREGTGPAFDELSRLTGLVGEDLRQTFEKDALSVFEKFIQGLGRVGEGGGDVAAKLEEFGLKGEEILKILPTLAERSELVGKSLKLAAENSKDASALNAEASQAFATTASKLELAKNKLDGLLVSLGEDVAPQVIESVNEITKTLLENKDSIIAIVSAVATVVAATVKAFSFIAEEILAVGDAEAKLLIKLRKDVTEQNEFLKKELSKRGLTFVQFEEERRKIRRKAAKEEKKEQKDLNFAFETEEVRSARKIEKIKKARADQLVKIEQEQNKRLIAENKAEVEELILIQEGASQELIDLKREERESISDINQLQDRIDELSLIDHLSKRQQIELDHTKQLLEFQKIQFDSLLEKQEEFSDALIYEVEEAYKEIEELEIPDLSIDIDVNPIINAPVDAGDGGGDGGSGGGGTKTGEDGDTSTEITVSSTECSTGRIRSYDSHGLPCAGGYSKVLGGCFQDCCEGYYSNGKGDCVEYDTSTGPVETPGKDGGEGALDQAEDFANNFVDALEEVVTDPAKAAETFINILKSPFQSMSAPKSPSSSFLKPEAPSQLAPANLASSSGLASSNQEFVLNNGAPQSPSKQIIILDIRLKDDLVNFIEVGIRENQDLGTSDL